MLSLPYSHTSQLLGEAIHHGLDTPNTLGLLHGSWAPQGSWDCVPYLPIIGLLASKYGQGPEALQGAAARALAQAQLGTCQRVEQLQAQLKSMERYGREQALGGPACARGISSKAWNAAPRVIAATA